MFTVSNSLLMSSATDCAFWLFVVVVCFGCLFWLVVLVEACCDGVVYVM